MKFQLIWARPIIRDNEGPDIKLPSENEWYVKVNDRHYPLSRLTSAPPVLQSQIETHTEFNSIEVEEPEDKKCRSPQAS